MFSKENRLIFVNDEQIPESTSQEVPQEVPEIEPGTPQDYAEFLVQNKDFSFSYILKLVRDEGTKPPYEDYKMEWTNNPKKAADYIEAIFPAGKGKKEFVEALRKPPEIPETGTTDPDYQNAYEILLQIIKQLRDRESYYLESARKRKEQIEKEGAVPDTLRQSLGNLVDNFRNGSAMDKAVTIAAIGIGIKILMTLKDKKFPFAKEGSNFTWWSAGKWILGGWAVNELSRKVSKSGKSIFERITNMGLPVENLRTSMWGAFALDGKKENQEVVDPNETKQMLMFADKDIKLILKVYERSPSELRDKFSPEELESMGFSSEEIKRLDGKTAFKIVDKLVKRVGRNYFSKKRQQLIDEGKLPASIPESQIDFGKFGVGAIKAKYTEGQLASHKWTFEEIMTEEYIEVSRNTNFIEDLYKDYENAKLPAKVKEGVMAVIAALEGITEEIRGKKEETPKEKGKKFGEKIRKKFNKVSDAVKNKIRKLLKSEKDEEFSDKFKGASPEVKNQIMELLKIEKEKAVKTHFPSSKTSTITRIPPS